MVNEIMRGVNRSQCSESATLIGRTTPRDKPIADRRQYNNPCSLSDSVPREHITLVDEMVMSSTPASIWTEDMRFCLRADGTICCRCGDAAEVTVGDHFPAASSGHEGDAQSSFREWLTHTLGARLRALPKTCVARDGILSPPSLGTLRCEQVSSQETSGLLTPKDYA